MPNPAGVTEQVQELDHVIIRFAGDSGVGMQLTGDRFTQETAVFGNGLSTLPNFRRGPRPRRDAARGEHSCTSLTTTSSRRATRRTCRWR
jgi:hypothetical protein